MRNFLAILSCSVLTGACAAADAPKRSTAAESQDTVVWLHTRPGAALHRPDRLRLLNADGSPRVLSEPAYEHFWRVIAPEVEAWAADPRLAISPALVAALLAKESGFQPFAMSAKPAFGYAQLTPIMDRDLQQMVEAEGWRWMRQEVLSWPRHPDVHHRDATRQEVRALIAQGAVTAGDEYFFDPPLATRAAVFWIRLLQEVWTSDAWPGMYGSLARRHLSEGGPISEAQLVDLVLVSYNQGYPYARDLVERHGRSWTEHLNAESADYLERIRAYAVLFQGDGAAAAR